MKWVGSSGALVLFREEGFFSCRNPSLMKSHHPASGVAVEVRVKMWVIPRAVSGEHQFGEWVAWPPFHLTSERSCWMMLIMEW